MRDLFSCEILGRPYVKKNTQRVVGFGKAKRVIYSPQYLSWKNIAMMSVLKVKSQREILGFKYPIDFRVNLSVRFFLKNGLAEPDLSALYEGIQDVLEACDIITNDRLIYSHNGSFKSIDRSIDESKTLVVLSDFVEV